jgi:hypothetical protein
VTIRRSSKRCNDFGAASSSVKPSIPLIGDYGIEMHDELTLELPL